jgi:DNA invertase Pin-like site-specific DNA recombinase
MIAAIYARKSTDQSGVSDDQKSVARQIEHAHAFAASKGWTIGDEYVFVDDGISGAEFATRPGFLRLMNSLKPRAPFQILIMSEESRLGREAIETAYALKQIVLAGVRVWFYLESRERTLDSPTDKIMLSLTAFADELEREKARQRTHDAMQRKARAGHVCGGRTFGYENVEVLGPDGRRSHVERRILASEAEIVRTIFTLSAEGLGLTAIAHTLNERRAPCPRPQAGRPAGWCRSTIREILHRDIYRGVAVWNRSRKRDQWGQKRQVKGSRERQQWIEVEQPAARIVPDELWNAAHNRLGAVRERALRLSNGKLLGRPPASGVKYLLSGMLTCGACGSSLEARTREHGRKRAVFYGCAGYSRKGKHVCSNGLAVPMSVADDAVLQSVERIILNADVVLDATQRALAALSTDATADRRATLERELKETETELARLSAAIAAGGTTIPS